MLIQQHHMTAHPRSLGTSQQMQSIKEVTKPRRKARKIQEGAWVGVFSSGGCYRGVQSDAENDVLVSERRSAWSPGSFLPKVPLQAQFYQTLLVSNKMVNMGNSGYEFEILKATLPEELASVNVSIRDLCRFALRAIDACSVERQCGAKEFKQSVYIASSGGGLKW